MAETSTCRKIGVDQKKENSFNYFALFDKIGKRVIINQTEARMGKVRKIKRGTNGGLKKSNVVLDMPSFVAHEELRPQTNFTGSSLHF